MFAGQRRYGRDPSVVVRAAPATFNAPLSPRWRRRAAAILTAEGRPMRVFTCSWSDFLHEDADRWRADAWEIIRRCPQYAWQLLTKRPERFAECLPADWGAGWPHVWLGVSIENRRFVGRAELLRAVPAAVRFISAEPLLGSLDGLDLGGIDWVIAGGESGREDRPLRVQWARELRDRCVQAGAPFFFKQHGGPRADSGGRLLDGRTWDQMPQRVGERDRSGRR
jgi:protein gp37